MTEPHAQNALPDPPLGPGKAVEKWTLTRSLNYAQFTTEDIAELVNAARFRATAELRVFWTNDSYSRVHEKYDGGDVVSKVLSINEVSAVSFFTITFTYPDASRLDCMFSRVGQELNASGDDETSTARSGLHAVENTLQKRAIPQRSDFPKYSPMHYCILLTLGVLGYGAWLVMVWFFYLSYRDSGNFNHVSTSALPAGIVEIVSLFAMFFLQRRWRGDTHKLLPRDVLGVLRPHVPRRPSLGRIGAFIAAFLGAAGGLATIFQLFK